MGSDDRIQRLTMPQWGFSMTEGKVVAWLVDVGREIARGDEIAEVETDKSVGVVESPVTGVLRRHVATPGQDVPVGGLIAVVADASVTDAEVDEFVRNFVADDASEEKSSGPRERPEFVTIDGRSIRYLKQGDGGEPVVLIHGFTGSLTNWAYLQTALAGDRAVYSLDLPGHGQSSKDVGEASIAFLTDVVSQWLDVLELQNVHLVGHSLGGAIALSLALGIPEKVRTCTAIASAGLGPEIDAEYIRGIVRADRRKELKPYLERLFADPTLATRQLVDDVLKYKRIDGVQSALERLAENFLEEGNQRANYRNRLADVKVPLQIVWGEADRIVPSSHAANLPESIEVHVLGGSGHMVQLEAAAEVQRLIARFASSQPERSAHADM